MRRPSSSVLPLLLMMACKSEGPAAPVQHFDPPSDSTLTEPDPVVHILGLDEESVICYTLDGSPPVWGDCAYTLENGERDIAMPCGFSVLTIAWDEGLQSESANYLVDTEACAESGPEYVTLWANDELVRAFVDIKDTLQCSMNGCQNPSGTGDWSSTCGGGQVTWNVRLSGLRAISTFTYTGCEASTTIAVHDYAADPYVQDESLTIPMEIHLTLNGSFTQDTDFGGNGSESGTVQVSGDFTGEIDSRIEISDAARAGGGFAVGCTADPLNDEICAPAGAKIYFEYPDWSCAVCPEPGDVPPAADADEDGIGDEEDNCVDVANPTQDDLDEDGLGDACDDEVGFVLIQFKTDGRCAALGATDIESTSTCNPLDRRQQWVIVDHDGHTGFQSRANDQCISKRGILAGPWTVTAEDCNPGSAAQQWNLELYDQGGFDSQWPMRLHNQESDFCWYTDLTGNIYGTIWNCGLAGTESNRKIGLYPGGDFTQLPMQP